MNRLIASIRAGIAAAHRTWHAGAVQDERARAHQQRLAGATDRELLRWSRQAGRAVVEAELRRRGLAA